VRLMDVIFPRTCPVCNEVLPSGNYICRDCLDKLSFIREPYCEKCGKRILTKEQRYCYDCAHRQRSIVKARAMLDYDEVSQKIMTGIKYKNKKEHAQVIGKLMALRLGEEVLSWDVDCIVPVPVHKRRSLERGYNQAKLLADALGAELDIPVEPDVLIRTKPTAAMKTLGATERRKELENAFQIGQIPSGIKRILLIDDIYTTGSTLDVCANILYEAGIETYAICACAGSDY